MKLKKLTKTIGLCGVMFLTYSTPSFAWDRSCDASCPKNIFGGSDLACNLWHGANCGIQVPKIPTLDDLLTSACAIPYKAVTNVIYNNCIRNSAEGLTDIKNAPKNLKLAAAILSDLGFYKLQDFDNVKISSCANLDSGVGGVVPVPDRIVLNWLRYYSDDGYALAPLLGHEMRHVQQIREKGYDQFGCDYSHEMQIGHGQGTNNFLEAEGYTLEQNILNRLQNYSLSTSEEDVLINNFLNPPVPPPPPTQAQINGALTAINALLLDDDTSCTFKLSQTNVTVPKTAGTYNVNVTTDAACDWKSNSNVIWLGSSSGKGNGTLNFSVTATDAYNNRTGTITLTSSNGGSQTLTVTQLPKIKETISVTNASIYEGGSGKISNMNFNVRLSTPSTKAITVSYYTSNSTALASSDYAGVPASILTFNAGETSKNISVQIYGDSVRESNETFVLYLNFNSPTSSYSLLTNKAIGTILNDD